MVSEGVRERAVGGSRSWTVAFLFWFFVRLGLAG